MEREVSSLLIKSNRVLGTRLVEAGLTTLEDMDAANELFISRAREKDLKRASLLRILIYDNQTLKEERLLDYQIEHQSVGAVMLENYNIDEVLLLQQPLEFMRASWTIPIDFVNDRWFVASAYYLSSTVRKFWEDRLEGRISWYVSSLSQFEAVFSALESKQEELAVAEKKAAEKAAAKAAAAAAIVEPEPAIEEKPSLMQE
jgi:hypothetical protein